MKQKIIKRLGWGGAIYLISSLNKNGVKRLIFDIMEYIESYRKELDDKKFAEEEYEILLKIQEEGRYSIFHLENNING